MGVLGLTPFLQRICPDVIRELPNRFKAITGKTIVVDATLITTRFHFSNLPHDCRHVLGWYRLLKELRMNDVQVICVFDGKERVFAKKAENARRRELREAALARGSIEDQRAQRLREFERILPYLTSDVLSQYPSLLPKFAEPLPLSPPLPQTKRPKASPRKPPIREHQKPSAEDDVPNEASSVPPPSTDNVSLDDSLKLLNEALANLSVEATPSPTSAEIAQTLEALHDSYAKSLHLLGTDSPVILSNTSVLEEVHELGPDLTVSLTRSQREIAVSEGEIWASLSRPCEDLNDIQAQLSDLAHKSETISSSYRRTSELPKEATFSESKMIIEAMGVPWIEAQGDYEAEALASSLVINGLADYVGSEDTDVLVYQAPLIRNITSQSEPLSLIFGADIPAKLGLSPSSFVDFAVLIGTDFSPRLKGLGPHRALKLLQTHETIERSLEATKPRYAPGPQQTMEGYLQQVDAARHIFSSLPPKPSIEALRPKVEYNAQLVNDILEQFDLTGYAARASRNEARPFTTLEEDYFANNNDELSLQGETFSLADDPKM